MNKLYTLCFFAAVMLLQCSENDQENNPVEPPKQTLTKEGTISSSETWSEKDKVYRVTADCWIEAPVTWGAGTVIVVDPAAVIHISKNGILTIEEGVRVKSGENSYIEVGKDSPGTLIANGSSSDPILFEADTGVQVWGAPLNGGIVLNDSAINVRMNHCRISGATAGIYVKTGSPLITNCQIYSCEGNGIYFDSSAGPSDSLSFTKNLISDCNGYSLTLPVDKLSNLSAEISFSNQQGEKNAIRVIGKQLGGQSLVWKKMAVPYLFTGKTIIGTFSDGITDITIMPGVVCKFEPGASFIIGSPAFGSAMLVAKGTPTDSIFFINSSEGKAWGDSIAGLWVGMESPFNTVFEYCSIKNATTGIYVQGTKITASHCLITGCDSNGITFENGSPLDSTAFQDNFFVGNGGYGISISADRLINLSGSGSVARNAKGGLYVSGADIWTGGTWKKYDSPYVVDGVIEIGNSDGVEIRVHPGTEFSFLPGSFISLGKIEPGTLIADGSSDLPIIFSSYIQDEYWGADTGEKTGAGIIISEKADANTILNYCKIQHATSGVYVNANVKIQNCTFRNNQKYGLVLDKNWSLESISENIFSDNGVDSIYTIH